jgi:hypothetical protein
MPCSPEITPFSERASAMMRATAAWAVCSMSIIVGVDGDVGVHIAIAGMHMESNEDSTTQDAFVYGRGFFYDGLECCAAKNLTQG